MNDNVDVNLSLMDLKVIIASLKKFKHTIPFHCIDYVRDLTNYLIDQHNSKDKIINAK
jgi:hypothetical protein